MRRRAAPLALLSRDTRSRGAPLDLLMAPAHRPSLPLPAVAGIDRYPRKITKSMKEAKMKKLSKIKPFIKPVNYTHMMPTRYVRASAPPQQHRHSQPPPPPPQRPPPHRCRQRGKPTNRGDPMGSSLRGAAAAGAAAAPPTPAAAAPAGFGPRVSPPRAADRPPRSPPCPTHSGYSYSVDMDIKKTLADSNLTNPESRLKARQAIKGHFEERYLNQATFKSEKKASGNNYFFKKLRF